ERRAGGGCAPRPQPPPLAPLAPHQRRPGRDAAHALERGGVVSGPSRVQASARSAELASPTGQISDARRQIERRAARRGPRAERGRDRRGETWQEEAEQQAVTALARVARTPTSVAPSGSVSMRSAWRLARPRSRSLSRSKAT